MKNIVNIIKESNNKYEVLKKLGWDYKTYGYRKLNKIIKSENIDISHFETRRELYNRTLRGKILKSAIPLSEILISGSTYANTVKLKEKLYKARLKERKCELCGQGEEWQGKHMSLILDHINGIHDDHRFENLRIVCPNCNATLSTHCGKNIKKRKKLPKEEKVYIRKRKVDRPQYDDLIADIKLLGYSGTGRKYGVSDNAIRKWVKNY
jgi:hypothetical protein